MPKKGLLIYINIKQGRQITLLPEKKRGEAAWGFKGAALPEAPLASTYLYIYETCCLKRQVARPRQLHNP